MALKQLIYLLSTTLLAACGTAQRQTEDKLYVSIQPLRELVGEIVGGDFDVEVLVPAGASPETFEPTARQMVELDRSKLIFSVGLLDFETTLLAKIEEREKIVDLSRGIALLAGSCSHNHGHSPARPAKASATECAACEKHTGSTKPSGCAECVEHTESAECTGHRHTSVGGETNPALPHRHAHGIDPHIWTSPKSLLRMAENAFEAIRHNWPDSAKYAANYRQLQARLQALDEDTAAKIAAGSRRYFIIYHPAYTYYARDYGLRQEAIEADGKEPSARRMAEIIRQAREDGVRKIFYQSQFPASAVEVIARDIGAEAVQVDPLREDVTAGIEQFTDLIVSK